MDAPAPHLPPVDDKQLLDLFARAEEIGLLLEVTDGGITWEAWPGREHQDLTLAVLMSIRPREDSGDGSGEGECDCYRSFDLSVRFADGTVKRPDISIFCKRPIEAEGFVHAVPEAVVEITSPGYEEKDRVNGPPIYLRNGVRDVIVLDRQRGEVVHWTKDTRRVHPVQTEFTLQCGYRITV